MDGIHGDIFRAKIRSGSKGFVEDRELADAVQVEQLPTKRARVARSGRLVSPKKVLPTAAQAVAVRLDNAVLPRVFESNELSTVDRIAYDAQAAIVP